MADNNGTFSELLKALAFSYQLKTPARTYDWLKKRGCNIGKTCFYQYYNGITCPSIAKANAILETFDYKANEGELVEILENSMDNRTENSARKKAPQRTVILKVKDYGLEDQTELEMRLSARMKELNAETFSQYVNKLIQNDLRSCGLLNEATDEVQQNE